MKLIKQPIAHYEDEKDEMIVYLIVEKIFAPSEPDKATSEIERYYRHKIKTNDEFFNLIDIKNFIRVIKINDENCLMFHIKPEHKSFFFQDFCAIFPQYK